MNHRYQKFDWQAKERDRIARERAVARRQGCLLVIAATVGAVGFIYLILVLVTGGL